MPENKIEILVTAQDTQMDRAFGRMGDRMRNLGRQAGELGRSLAIPAAAMAGLAIVSLKSFATFEKQLVRAGAVSNATAAELTALEDAARDMGRTTMFTATQSAEALAFLAMAGNDATTSIKALPSVLQLAAAGSLELGQAADIVTNVMAGMQLSVGDLGRANDVLVTAFTSANTNLQQLGQAFKFVGPVAANAGVSFEETAAALALMGNRGIQASMAGTGLRGAIVRLLSPSKEAAKIMDRLGIVAKDSAGKMLPLKDIVKQLEAASITTGDAMTIFGLRAGPAMLGLVAEGSKALEDLTEKMLESGGTAKRISDAQLATFSGQMLIVKSAIESVAIEIGKTLVPMLTDFVDGLKPVIGGIESFVKLNPGWVKGIGLAGAALAILAASLLAFSVAAPLVATVIGTFSLALGGLSLAIGVARGAWELYRAGLITAQLAQWGMNIAMAANPIGAIALVAALATAGAAFVLFRKQIGNVVKGFIPDFSSIGNVVVQTSKTVVEDLGLIEEALEGVGDVAESASIRASSAIDNDWIPSVEGLRHQIGLLGDEAEEVFRQAHFQRAVQDATPSVKGLRFQIGLLGDEAEEAFRQMQDIVTVPSTVGLHRVTTTYKELIKQGSLLEQSVKAIGDTFAGVFDEELAAMGGIDERMTLFNQTIGRVADGVKNLAGVVMERLIPSLTELQEELVLDKLAALKLEDELGPLRDAMSVLAEQGLGNVIQAFADGLMSQEAFLEIALAVKEAVEGETQAIKDQVDALKALQTATDEMKDVARIGPGGVAQTQAEALAGALGGFPIFNAKGDLVANNLSELTAFLASQAASSAVASFAGGGTVPGPIGQPMAAIVHGGEVITSPGQGGGAQQVLNIAMNIGTVIGISDLDEHIVRTWTDTARRGGFDGLIQVT